MSTETQNEVRSRHVTTANEQHPKIHSAGPVSEADFFWTYQEEPHRSRRMEIIKAHPEVTKLTGHEPLTKWVVLGVVSLQFTCAYLLRNSPILSWPFLITAYVIGAVCIQNLFLAIHELSHNLGFKKPIHNKLFSIFANAPIGIPYSAGFGPYHLLHHKHLGDFRFDTDLPTPLEAALFSNVAGKAFFATFQLFFYAIRPICVAQLPFSIIHFLNIAAQVAVDVAVIKFWGMQSFWYLIISSFFAGSLHPVAGHFIAEHYVLGDNVDDAESTMKESGSDKLMADKNRNSSSVAPPETYSYYGILNLVTYNVGYHNEHHDFPFVPWTRLPALREMAKDFYDPLPQVKSWSMTIVDFIRDDRVSLWCRVKRDEAQMKRLAART
ncbi:fatty acid desaturase-domain-containing protein [Yarrowia lipolytica]|jgi:sphingolipid delta-4 desaturase|uniref:Sphingolipid delta(4)-desaturase n=2 Tax=Yarrowia lipolytica TaxID=4952 RepID=Q6CA36_YARLI|nr:YALI0D06237p [Yarrowia lipolytica CLIB122]AOW03660.1 hypothetical protein YALI1_D08000g [Yarrowia lipolytica]KAB8284420.1 fatty acid desaturase-domain-containing protein [Yarrowia lipolytica]KAE8172604.1 fatty acid desaturase-domain-containing protein [Yarrowia lipolytica]KAJ8054732.1 fatty acid desaturase-domain-containing protein [Yarrowia lipolytica]QNP97676.1 Sphingolipid delta(4)-desaturase [Yarrowia lipolytica]|eukprot:XP_502476.1 YALI0D06237p [Yarrowia lipolytica CLIB122]